MTIEERILKLGLDNQNFENHAAESLKTLDRLEQTLSSFGSAIGFDKIGNMIDTVTNRFSALGIAGDQVIRNLTNQVMNLVGHMTSLANSMSIEQISAGFSKYGEKTESVQTIMAATAKDWDDQEAQMKWVNDQLLKLNWFTDETSYSFLDMVNNIGKFTSNGVKLEDSVTAMEGISTWAALSGANVSEAGRAMYNLSQALAQGSVKLMDWKSIENANMSTREFKETALETAVALGTLTKNADGTYTVASKLAKAEEKASSSKNKKTTTAAKTVTSFTAEQFNTQLSEGWFTKDVLMETLKKYGNFTDVLKEASEETGETATRIIKQIELYKRTGEVADWLRPYIDRLASSENELGFKAFKAAQEAKTFKDAINATKDAVSTGWMNLWENIFGNYLEAKKLWTNMAESLYNIFAEPINKLNKIVRIAFRGEAEETTTTKSGWDQLQEKILATGHTMDEFEIAFHKVISATEDASLSGLVDEYGSLEEAFKSGAISADLFRQILRELTGTAEDASDDVAADAAVMNKSLEDMRTVALEVLRGDHGNGQERIDWLTENGYDPELIQAMAGNLKNFKENYGSYDMSDDQLIAAMEAYYQYMGLADRLGRETFADFLTAAGYTEEQISAVNDLLENADESLDGIKNGVKETQKTTQDGTAIFADSINNLMHVFEGLYMAVDEAFTEVFGDINTLGSSLGDAVKQFHKFTESIQLADISEEAYELNERGERLRDIFTAIFRVIHGVTSAIKIGFSIFRKLVGFAFKIAGLLFDRITALIEQLHANKFLKNAIAIAQNLVKAFEGSFRIISGLFGKIFKADDANGIPEWTTKVSNGLGYLAARLAVATDLFQKFMNKPETLEKIQNGLEKISNATQTVKNVFSKAFNIIKKVALITWNAISGVFSKFSNIGILTKSTKEGESTLSKFVGVLRNAAKWIGSSLETIKTGIQEAFGKDNGVGLTKILGNLLGAFLGFKAIKGLGGIFGKLGDLFGGIGSIGEFLSNPASIFKNFADGLSEMLGFTKKEGSFVKDLRSIAISIGILAASLLLLASIPEENIATALGHLTTMLMELIGAVKVLDYMNPGKTVGASALAMIEIAAAMLILAWALRVLSNIDQDKMNDAWRMMTMSLLSMVVALYALGKVKIKASQLFAAGAAIMGIAIAMLILSAALFVFTKLDPERMNDAWRLMTMSLLSMVVALYALGKVNAVSLLAAGTAMIAVAAAMLILSLALAAISFVVKHDENVMMEFITVIAVMVIALGLLGGLGPVVLAAGAAIFLVALAIIAAAAGLILLSSALHLLNKVDIDITHIIELAGALIILGIAGIIFGLGGLGLLVGGAGLLVLGVALNVFNNVKVAPDYLLSFGGALMVLGIAGIIFGLGGLGLILGGAGLLVLGLALNTFNSVNVAPDYLFGLAGALLALGVAGVVLGLGAIGLIGGSLGLYALGRALPTLAEGVNAFSDISGDALKATFFALAEAIGALFLLQFSSILDGTPVLQGLAEAMPSLAEGFKSFENLNGSAISTAGEGLSKAIGSLFKLQFASFRDGSEELKNLATVIPSLAEGFRSFEDMDGDAISTAGEGLSKAIGSLFKLQFASFKDGTAELSNLATVIPALATAFQEFENLNAEALSTTGLALSETISTLFKLQFSTIKDGTPQLQALGEALPKIAEGFKAFATVDADWLKQISKALSVSLSDLTSGGFFSKKRDYTSLSELGGALSVLWDGLSGFSNIDDVESVLGTISSIFEGAKTSISSSQLTFETTGQNISAALASGIREYAIMVLNEIQMICENISHKLTFYDSVWKTFGRNISIGIANGIIEKMDEAINAMSTLAESIQKTFAVSLTIQSPSKVMEDLAENVPAGISKGIQNGSDELEEEMITVISPILAAMNALADSDEFDISPTITPVIDSSQYNYELEALRRTAEYGQELTGFNKWHLLTNTQDGAYETLLDKTAANARTAVMASDISSRWDDYVARVDENNNAIESSFNLLSGKVDELSYAISNMQIVLDTGTIAGEMTTKIDQNLGTAMARRGRAN